MFEEEMKWGRWIWR